MRPVLRLGLCGCGRLAEAGYLPAVAGLPDLRVDAIADPDPQRRSVVAAGLALDGSEPRGYRSMGSMLAAGHLDGVIVASPPRVHLSDAREAAAAGLRALVEKPPAASVEEAMELAVLEPQPLFAFNRRFGRMTALREAARTVRGAHGGPLELDVELRYRRASWRPIAGPDDALLDLAPHAVDLASWALGRRPSSVAARSIGPSRAELELALDDSIARIRLATDRAHLERASLSRLGGAELAAVRSDGRLRGLLGRLRGDEHPLVASLRAELAAYAAALRGAGTGRLGSALDAVTVMIAIEAARESAERRGRPVELAGAEQWLSGLVPSRREVRRRHRDAA